MMNSQRVCPECDEAFTCGGEGCWCLALPAMLPPSSTASCLCPGCLPRRLGILIEKQLDQLDHEQALELARHERRRHAPVEHLDYTMEEGKLVFTRWYLLKRSRCCGEQCRNCPYPESARPRKTSCRAATG